MTSPEPDRTRRHTARAVLRRLDDAAELRLAQCAADPTHIEARLQALDREWDLDRTIEAEAASMGLAGLALGTLVSHRLLALPAVVGASLFLFGTRGLYPLLPAFRRLGLRSAREIERERQALKVLRGDFDGMAADAPGPDVPLSPEAIATLRH